MSSAKNKVADLIVKCLENEGVEYIFGLPGEENIDLIEALNGSKIRFILTRHEQGASFMADIYGRLTRKAGVCLATLGPGGINLILGTADANLDSSPLVALVAQATIDRLNKESHQIIDLKALFEPVTKWSSMITLPDASAEVMRKAFKLAETDRMGATAVIIPEDIAASHTDVQPLPVAFPKPTMPNENQIARAAELLNQAKNPIILAGHGICRYGQAKALRAFAEHCQIPVATTFMAKGVISDDSPLSLGSIGFMRHDYSNFGFDKADVIIAIGYDLVEYSPDHWNPEHNKKVIHIHGTAAEVDSAYPVSVGIQGDMAVALNQLGKAMKVRENLGDYVPKLRNMLHQELSEHADDQAFPLKPQRIVSDLRAAMKPSDIVLCDTGALKMWMARLYPCYEPDTCIISNSLATMGFSLPGALAAKLAHPEKKILACMGDGSFLMNSQELETAKRENIPFVVLIWRDNSYGLIGWKQRLEFGHEAHVEFSNPDFSQYAQSFGIKSKVIKKADELLPALQEALDSNELYLIDCPVDYSENIKLTDKLGHLTRAL